MAPFSIGGQNAIRVAAPTKLVTFGLNLRHAMLGILLATGIVIIFKTKKSVSIKICSAVKELKNEHKHKFRNNSE